MNNEPVAWISENGRIFDELPPISDGLMPLYAHPVKTLTDEEIVATFNYFCSIKDQSKSAINDSNYFQESMVLYARLILETASKKAQE